MLQTPLQLSFQLYMRYQCQNKHSVTAIRSTNHPLVNKALNPGVNMKGPSASGSIKSKVWGLLRV